MECVCMKDTIFPADYIPLNTKETVTYQTEVNYKSTGPSIGDEYTSDYKTVTRTEEMFLRIQYPYLWKVGSWNYHERLYHCPFCGRFFPPNSKWEKKDYERKMKIVNKTVDFKWE